MKFKVGDKVRILQGKNTPGLSWFDDFDQHVGKELVISRVCEEYEECYRFNEIGYWWYTNWLELVVEEDLTFSSQQEIYQWLAIPGNKVISELGAIVGFNESGQMFTFSDDCSENWYFSEPTDWKKYVKKEWWKNIPDHGVLCWVSYGDGEKELKIVIEHTQYHNYPFRVLDGGIYDTAIPLTDEEVKKYILRVE